MRIQFCLAWAKSGSPLHKAFKLSQAYSLFREYVERIASFVSCEVSGGREAGTLRKPATKVWICHRGAGAKMFSSEELAKEIEKLRLSGTKELHIVIGGPDGFSEKDLEMWNPDLKWSFGSLTFPHELAAVVASEQIYRALTILHYLPYHSCH
jgi:23S rRNA (pseudouridine1915-N3)-methyltransferase